MDNANIRQTTGLQVFYNENENVNVRTQVINDEPWFVAKDVAMALNITWSGHTLDNIPNEWTQMVKLTINGSQTSFPKQQAGSRQVCQLGNRHSASQHPTHRKLLGKQ